MKGIEVLQRGFTLIELMIVVAIIGILVAIAYPSYQEHIKAGHRSEAESDLSELAQFMERYYTENNKYDGVTMPFTQSPRPPATKLYTISVTASGDTYTITASPTGTMSGDRCNSLTIDQTGNKGTSPAATGCW
jgi:type IV pilus assembly protein PilE